jgi:hypothetical protein
LLVDAAALALQAVEVLRSQVDRMLDDPRSQRFIDHFLDEWLDLREIDFTTPDFGTGTPIFFIACLNSSRSSPLLMATGLAPIIWTPYFSRIPRLWSSIEVFNAVWPPTVGRSASGRSLAMILSTTSQVIGSMYVRSAISGSVMIVAGLELTNTTS